MSHPSFRHLAAFAVAFSALITTQEAVAAPGGIKNVVLVHGAWADGTSWSKVIPLLESKGLNVVSVQNPVLGLADDAAAVKRALAGVEGPTLLVGHSWGGVVITEAGDDPKVAGLVYVSSPLLDVGQSLTSAAQGYPPAPGNAEVRSNAKGFLVLTWPGVEKHFALDLSRSEARLVWIVQGDSADRFPTDTPTVAAWKTRPSWSVIGSRDHMLNPEMLQASARAAGAKITVLDASHLVLLSKPRAVADVILRACADAPTRVGQR